MNFVKKTKTLWYSMELSHGMRRALMSSLMLVYFIYLGFDVIAATSLFAISSIILMLFEFPTGAIADYDSRKKSIAISFIMMSLAFFGLFYFRSFGLLAASWILGDIAWTFYSGAGSAWAIDALKYAKKKSKIISLISRGYLFEKGGYLIGGLIGALLVAVQFRFVWLFVSLNYLLMFFLILFYMEERNFKPSKPEHYLKKPFIKAKESFQYVLEKGNRELRILMIAGFFSTWAANSFFIGVPLLLTEFFKLGPESLPLIFSMSSLVALSGPIISEKIANKIGFRKPLYLSFLFMGFLMIIFSSANLLISILSFIILGTFLAGTDVLQDSAYHHEFSSKIRASLGSLNSIINTIARSIAFFLTGLSIISLGTVSTILISAGLSILTALIYFIGLERGEG